MSWGKWQADQNKRKSWRRRCPYETWKASVFFWGTTRSHACVVLCEILEMACTGLRTCLGETQDPLQYSCLESSMDGGAWWAAAHGVPKSRTWLNDFTFTSFKTVLISLYWLTFRPCEGRKWRPKWSKNLSLCWRHALTCPKFPYQWLGDISVQTLEDLQVLYLIRI